MGSIKKNFLYNVFYQMLLLIVPLITVPYISRIIGVKGVGIFSYTYTIVNYFILFAMLGINNYGNRSIAKCRDDKLALSKSFLSIYTIQIISSLLISLFYITYVFFFSTRYKFIAIIQIIALLSCFFDINWFFFGLEKFKITIVRNTVIKILTMLSIFLFVKKSDDLVIYTLITATGTLLSTVVLLPFLTKEIKFVKIGIHDITCHIKPIFVLFIPIIAVSLYKMMDKIMLGSFCKISEVGYYEQAEKIINIPLGIVTALGTVMMPRMSNLISKGNNERASVLMRKTINFILFLAFPICFGIIAISSDFVPIFLGKDFIKSGILIYFLAPTLVLYSFANVIRTQYLIPYEKDKIFVLSVSGGAIVNLIVNLLLISKMQSVGACIGTLTAEFFVVVFQTCCVRKTLPIKEYITDGCVCFLKSLIMFILVISLKFLPINVYVKIISQILLGVLIYFCLNYKYIAGLVDLKQIFK